VSLTPTKIKMLLFLAEMRFLSLPQIGMLCCPDQRQDLAEKNARRQMRALFDAGLVDVLPVSRLALAPPDSPNDHALLYGSAPNVYVPTQLGLDALVLSGLIEMEKAKQAVPKYGPKNSLFLAHELQVRDVRVWLELAARSFQPDQRVLRWQSGSDAVLEVNGVPTARPDAWFIHRIGMRGDQETVLVGLVEVDRGTERGDKRWQEKLFAYETLFLSGALKATTGYMNARILVITPDQKRRDDLAAFVADRAGRIASQFWFATHAALHSPDLSATAWKTVQGPSLRPLI